jgi:Na+-transporting methylmalonyl-CoA/oxaloacetate decarboxylase gamma subunit
MSLLGITALQITLIVVGIIVIPFAIAFLFFLIAKSTVFGALQGRKRFEELNKRKEDDGKVQKKET